MGAKQNLGRNYGNLIKIKKDYRDVADPQYAVKQ